MSCDPKDELRDATKHDVRSTIEQSGLLEPWCLVQRIDRSADGDEKDQDEQLDDEACRLLLGLARLDQEGACDGTEATKANNVEDDYYPEQ